MKNITFGMLFLASSVIANTQEVIQIESSNLILETGERVEQTSEWYNYGQTIYDLGGTVPYYRNFLFPDSTAYIQGDGEYFNVFIHSIGQVFDPTSFYFEISENTVVPDEASYVLDSIAIPYMYYRPQDSIADTLVVQGYLHSKHTTGTFGTDQTYAYVGYDYTTNSGASPDFTEIIILDNNDSITTGQGILEVGVGLTLGANELVSMTYSYIPGNPTTDNDTIDFYSTDEIVNPINAFIAYTYYDEDKNPDEGYYNAALMATTTIRYNDLDNANGWQGKYIPGSAYNGGYYHSDMYFKVSTIDVSIDEREALDLTISPNPASSIFKITNVEGEMNISIYDLTGKLLKQELAQENSEVSISDLVSGIYLVEFKKNGLKTVKKLVVE